MTGQQKRQVCAACEAGRHSHDTWNRGPAKGLDAGCPRSIDGHECRCPVRLPEVAR